MNKKKFSATFRKLNSQARTSLALAFLSVFKKKCSAIVNTFQQEALELSQSFWLFKS